MSLSLCRQTLWMAGLNLKHKKLSVCERVSLFPTELQEQEKYLCLLAELPVRRGLLEMLLESLEDRNTLALQEEAVRQLLLCGYLTRVQRAILVCDETMSGSLLAFKKKKKTITNQQLSKPRGCTISAEEHLAGAHPPHKCIQWPFSAFPVLPYTYYTKVQNVLLMFTYNRR